MVSATKIIEELIGISILGAIYILAFAPILTDAVANYTGASGIGAALGVVVGYLPVAVLAIVFVRIAMSAFTSK
jgi:hypothetical protein